MTLRSILITVTALFLSVGTAMAAPQLPTHKADLYAPAAASAKQSPSYVKFAQNRISASQAKSIALSRVRGGEYVDLRLVGNTYIVRVRAPGGRIVDIRVDARTGRVR